MSQSPQSKYKKNSDGHFICPYCGETKRIQSTMHYHMKKHEGKLPFECNICKKGFLHASTLDLHIKAQHQKEQERMFKCPMEGCVYKGTLTKSNLIIHFIRKHCKEEATAMGQDADRPLTCRSCNKETNSMTAFHYHIAGCIQIKDTGRQAHLNTLLGIQAPTN